MCSIGPAAAHGDDLFDEIAGSGAIGEVAEDRRRLDPTGRQILVRRIELGLVAGRQRHVCAQTPKFARDRQPEPSRAAGDQRRSAFKIHPACATPRPGQCGGAREQHAGCLHCRFRSHQDLRGQ